MGSVSLSVPQTLNLYAYCTNDPINHTDPSGLGFFSFLKKLFKWVMLAIAIVAAVLTIAGAIFGPIAMAAFAKTMLGGVLNFIANIPGLIGSSLFSGAAGSIAGALGFTEGALSIATNAINGLLGWGVLAAGRTAVGAIASNFDQVELAGDKRKQWNTARFVLLSVLKDPKSRCYNFLKSKGFDPDAIVKDVDTQKPFDGFQSTNPEDFGALGASPQEFFNRNANEGNPLDAATAPSGNIYYGNARGGSRASLVLHENLHKQLPSLSEDALGQRLGTWKSQRNRNGTYKDSSAINKTLERNGCK